jgi:hypothetical protein
VYQRVLDRGVPVKMAFNHGACRAFYFEDPEGAPARGLLAHGSPLASAARGAHRLDTLGRSTPPGRGGASEQARAGG